MTNIFNIGGVQGSGGTGLKTETVTGTPDHDTLALGVTNGQLGATGYKVMIEGNGSLSGTVEYITNDQPVDMGPVVDFSGIEAFTFTRQASKTNNDIVDATGVTSNLALNTGEGNDTVLFGAGNDTFVIGHRKFGSNVTDGGAGTDTIDLSAVTGAQRSDFRFSGTNLFENQALEVTRKDAAKHNVTFTNYEVIESGGGKDHFTSGYAPKSLESVNMAGGNDVFEWMTFNGATLNVDGGSRDDVIKIGGNIGAGASGLINGTVDGGDGNDTLELKFTLDRGPGFFVEFTGNKVGTVTYRDADSGPETTFENFESIVFSSFRGDSANNDIVDATESRTGQKIDTAAGNDKIDGGRGDDTLNGGDGNDQIDGNGGRDVINGGDGDDTLIGGDRNDTLTGGDGEDTFQFDDRDFDNNGGRTQRDTITDFEFGVDTAKFRYDGKYFAGSGITTINDNQAKFSTVDEFELFLDQVVAKGGQVIESGDDVLVKTVNSANGRKLDYLFEDAALAEGFDFFAA